MRISKIVVLVGCLFVFGSSIVSASNSDEVLLNAVSNGNVELAQTAIANGANVNCTLPQCYTPLVIAVKHDDVKMVKYLLAHGANPNQKQSDWNYWEPPLLIAVDRDNLPIAQMLVQAGADVNAPREMKEGGRHFPSPGGGITPLILAIQKEDGELASLSMVQFLVSKGADVNQTNSDGYTPLMAAANQKIWSDQKQNRCQIAKVLLAAGANPAKKDNWGKVALQYAMDTNFAEMINLLLPISPK